MAIASTAIQHRLPSGWVIGFILLHALCSAPMWSITSAIVFARLEDAKKEFGPIRAMATLGWMAGCWTVSSLGADSSTWSGYSGAVTWLMVAAFTCFLPALETPKSVENLTWHERLGLDALALLRHRDHRVVFITVALFAIPLAGFYPYAPAHLRDLGFQHTTAWMSLAQVTEVIAMLFLGRVLLRWRLKWVFACGLSFGVLRFALSAWDRSTWLVAGVMLHGVSYTLVYITAQIYLDQRVEHAWRTRAQALMALMSNGVGNLLGFLGAGAWFAACSSTGVHQWPKFWLGLTGAVAAVLGFFLVAYQGRSTGLLRKEP
jgi:MFS family permease